MIEINLLPEELRQKHAPLFSLNLEMEKIKIFIAVGLGAFLVLLVVFLSVAFFIRKGQVSVLTARENKDSSKISQIQALNSEITGLKVKIDGIDELIKRRFLWAQKLNQLSGLVASNTWFTHIYTDSENRLIIEGSVVSKSEEEMACVGKFMKNLKEDVEFFKDFKNIKLESVQRSDKDESGIVDFKIALYFL